MSRRFGPEAELHPSRQERWATRRYSITRGARCRRRDDRGRRVRGYRSRWKRRCETHTTAARHAALQTCGRSELAQAVWATDNPAPTWTEADDLMAAATGRVSRTIGTLGSVRPS